MNEYTRREEIRWTLASVAILVPAVAVGVVKLLFAQGPLITNPNAVAAATAAQAAVTRFQPCPVAAKDLAAEVNIYKDRIKAAQKKADDEAASKVLPGRTPPTNVPFDMPWAAAQPVLKHSKTLQEANCQGESNAAVGERAPAAAAWKAQRKAAKLAEPGDSLEKQQQVARSLATLFDQAPLEEIEKHTHETRGKLEQNAAEANRRRDTAKIRAEIAQGLFPRGTAIAVGVGIAIVALIVSFISLRSASMKRARTLIALRRFANTPEAGLQAAAIVRLAAHHNGGEPGMVFGAAVGGLIAALFAPIDDPNTFIGDLYVAGTTGGMLVGLALQWVIRAVSGMGSWRARTKELGDIEKPTIPVALVLGGVTPGLEKQFLRYFEGLPMADAAVVVQKLAAQAEDQILAAADAQHQGPQSQSLFAGPSSWPR